MIQSHAKYYVNELLLKIYRIITLTSTFFQKDDVLTNKAISQYALIALLYPYKL